MESSSENSFAWTDTSSDSNSMAAEDTNEKSDENCDFVNERKKKKKMSLTKKLANDKSVPKEYKEDIKGEQSNNFSPTKSNITVNKKVIKLEPESDYDQPKKKNKVKHNESDGNQNDSHDSMSYDETYLNMKVEQEELNASSCTKHKQKKQKQQSSTDSKNDNVQESGYDTKLKDSKKKKKKSKKRYDSEDHNVEIETKMDIDETVVNKQDYSVTENKTFEESEESGDEISAIKCDDEHSPISHTISMISKSLKDVTKTKTDNSLNETTSSQQKSEHDYKEKSEATQQRKQRISDRIRFEDDDDIMNSRVGVHENDFENSKKSVKLEQFVRTNSDLRLHSQKLDNNTTLTSDDEIWILKCPTEIDIKDFKNTSLNIYSKCKIKIAGRTYDGSAEEEQSGTVPLLTIEDNQYKIRNLPLSGIVNLRKRIPKAHFRDDNIMVNNQTNLIPLPDTKCRHPLFGSSYKKALKIPTAIAERLNMQNGEESLIKVESRKKKKHKKDRNKTNRAELVNLQEQHDLIMKLETNASEEITEKKKKKRKMIDDDGPTKKMKRIKHDLESAEAWESEKAIEENLFNF